MFISRQLLLRLSPLILFCLLNACSVSPADLLNHLTASPHNIGDTGDSASTDEEQDSDATHPMEVPEEISEANPAGVAELAPIDNPITTQGAGPDRADQGMPQASIPAPTLRKCLAYNPDYNYNTVQSHIPYACTANDELAPYGDGRHVLALSARPIEPRVTVSKLPEPSLFERLFRKAHAQEAMGTLHDICDESEITCCPINPDGSGECYYPLSNSSIAELNVAVVEQDGDIVFSGLDSIEGKALWMQSAPKGPMPTSSVDRAFALTEADVGVEIYRPANGHSTVLGDFEAQYGLFADTATQIAFTEDLYVGDSTSPQSVHAVVLRQPATPSGPAEIRVIPLSQRTSLAQQTVLGTSIAPKMHEQTEDYTVLKLAADGRVRYGIKTVASGWHRYYGAVYRAPDIHHVDYLFFLEPSYSIPNNVTHRQTLAFDVDDNKCALVLFEEFPVANLPHGPVRLHLGCGYRVDSQFYPVSNFRMHALESPLYSNFSEHDVVDIALYRTERIPAEAPLTAFPVVRGNGLLLDRATDSVWPLAYHMDPASSSNSFITPAALDPASAIRVGHRPSGMAVNRLRNRAYVVNEGDETVSILDLTVQPPVVIQTMTLQDSLPPGKSLAIRPNGISCQTTPDGVDHLLISAAGLKGSLTISVTP